MFNSPNSNENKPPPYPLPHPEQKQTEWNINNMPWKSNMEGSNGAVMLFNGLSLASGHILPSMSSPAPSTSGIFQRQPKIKRKSESDDFIPNKHFITEEKMIAHMNGLHLSDNYQQQNISHIESPDAEADMEPFNVNLSPQELEQRLKNAQRITVCDQVRRSLKEDNEILPKVLLDRIEQPCRALMLWQPPKVLEKLLTNFDYKSSDEEDEEIEMDDNNNNNDSDDDPNNDPNNNDVDMDL